jgi:hypothetical protein
MKKISIALLVVALAGFIYGLIHLFHLRFESGDNYPPYSTFRSDPLGARALFQSFDRLIPADRHVQPLSKLGEGRDTTLFWLGEEARSARFTDDEFKEFEKFLRTGGRLVIAFLPEMQQPRSSRFASPPPKAGPGALPPGTNAPPGSSMPWPVTPGTRWNFTLGYHELLRAEDKSFIPELSALRDSNAELPKGLKVHTSLHFSPTDPAWRTIYARVVSKTNELPVMMERPFGRGSLVVCADAFPFSNEALLQEREPQLLSWLTGSSLRVVFDETHLGVAIDPGIAALARKYRLHGAFAALLVLAALFIWKNTSSFMPPREEQLARERGELVEGRDSSAGFINLLRRHLPPALLMKTCVEQWQTHVARLRKPAPARLEAMQKLIDSENALEPRQRNPVRTYREFCQILKRKS